MNFFFSFADDSFRRMVFRKKKKKNELVAHGWKIDGEEFTRFISEVQIIVCAPNLSIHLW
ncbi:hypothetical protein Sjap_003075 [Stephania japonica]|uniref:Uncharacterized protein n=1 Tax=Stephania japonica TaxID=461633 RepID=A0AAP0KQP7_9MAGN